MQWVGLTYSLPSGSSSSPRVAVWRRLRQLGAASPTGSLYLLPLKDEHLEALGWLAQEIQDAGGDALVLRIERLEGDAEERLIELLRNARAEEYRRIAAEAEQLAEQVAGHPAGRKAGGPAQETASPERGPRGGPRAGDSLESAGTARVAEGEPASGAPAAPAGRAPEAPADLRDRLEKLRRRLADVVRIDFFHAPEGAEAAAALARLEADLGRGQGAVPAVAPAELARYRGRRWVTRPRPHVDRLASAWLIRRFIDPAAEIRYGDTPEEGEVSFDLRGAEFGHRGNLCTFETLIAAFGLQSDPVLAALAEIVHEIDLRDGLSARPEIPGVEGLLRGWAGAGWPDAELERHGIAVFEGLYEALRQGPAGAPEVTGPARPRGGVRKRPSPPRPARR